MEESFKNSSIIGGTSKHISELDEQRKKVSDKDKSDKDRDFGTTTMKSDISQDKMNSSLKLVEQIGSGLI